MQRARAQRTSVTAPLARLASRQHGVVRRRQLLALGFSPRAIATMLGNGHLIRIHPGVYAVGHARLSAQGVWMAAVLACGELACLSERDALARHDLMRIGSGDIHVTAPGAHRVAGVRCHVVRDRSALGIVVVDGIPVTSLERALLDCAPTLAHQRLRSLLEEVQRRGRFDLRRFSATLAVANGHHGVGRLLAALAEVSDTPPALRSELERRFLELIRAAGLLEPSANIVVAGALFDFVWPAQRVIVEVDSWHYHHLRRAFGDDRRKGNTVELIGWTLLRITDDRLGKDPAGVVAEVAAALAKGGDATNVR